MLNLDNKGYFLTYSQCNTPLERVLEKIKIAFHNYDRKVQNYIIAHEEHKDGGAHRHCYISLDRSLRTKVPARFLDIDENHPNIEFVRSAGKVIKYCIKEDQYITNMDLNKKVTKEDIAKKILSGIKIVDIVQENPKYLFGYSRLKQDVQLFMLDSRPEILLDRPCGLWIAGPAGSGKSTIARTKFGDYYNKDASKWWDGYNGEETVICDDVDLSWKDVFNLFKIWADRYTFNGQTKGGFCGLRPRRLIVTSNRTLEELLGLMNWPKDDYAPYLRRFNQYWITSPQDWEDQL